MPSDHLESRPASTTLLKDNVYITHQPQTLKWLWGGQFTKKEVRYQLILKQFYFDVEYLKGPKNAEVVWC